MRSIASKALVAIVAGVSIGYCAHRFRPQPYAFRDLPVLFQEEAYWTTEGRTEFSVAMEVTFEAFKGCDFQAYQNAAQSWINLAKKEPEGANSEAFRQRATFVYEAALLCD